MKLNIPRRVMIPLIVTSVIGGLAGAILLIKTPAQTFLKVLPWLLLGLTLLFAGWQASYGTDFGGDLTRFEQCGGCGARQSLSCLSLYTADISAAASAS